MQQSPPGYGVDAVSQHTPWQAAINNGLINTKNAAAYADALKAAVTRNGRNLIMHYDTWDAAKAGWYNEPWLGSKREAIHGTYSAGEFGPGQLLAGPHETAAPPKPLQSVQRRAAPQAVIVEEH